MKRVAPVLATLERLQAPNATIETKPDPDVDLTPVALVVEQLDHALELGEARDVLAVGVQAREPGGASGKFADEQLDDAPHGAQDPETQLGATAHRDAAAAQQIAELKRKGVQLLELFA